MQQHTEHQRLVYAKRRERALELAAKALQRLQGLILVGSDLDAIQKAAEAQAARELPL